MVPSSKSSPMGMGGPGGPSGPDPTQPLPPSGMGAPGNGFSSKNSPIMGGLSPATTDPNYAQQYHNFQQQLYATGSSRSQGGPGGPGAPGGHSPGMGPLPPLIPTTHSSITTSNSSSTQQAAHEVKVAREARGLLGATLQGWAPCPHTIETWPHPRT